MKESVLNSLFSCVTQIRLIKYSVSRGCIRMYKRDVEELARLVPISTPVFIHP
ncbi:L,D-transpeptidase [Bacillus sp. JJ1521]|uniref:L,D-transpeptidase n=1 Tax=Bacillus sp. JJ1521 TaxID=3122957 RepID=UPI003F68AE1F